MTLGLIEYLVKIVPVRSANPDRLAYKTLTKRTMPFRRLEMPRLYDDARLYEDQHSPVEMHSGQATPDPGADRSGQAAPDPGADIAVVTDDHEEGDADPP